MADEHDITPHVRTWNGFTKLLGYSMAGVVMTLILMAIFLL